MTVIRRRSAALLATLVASLGSACTTSGGARPADGGRDGPAAERGPADAAAGDGTAARPAHCNPLGDVHCLLPWPSGFFLRDDPATATGYRVAYPAAGMPANAKGVPVSPARYNLLDGFSVGTQPVVAFAEGLSAEGLPAQGALARSIGDESLIWIIALDSGERVPLFAELDANGTPSEVPGLIIRPARPLRFATRYAVVLRRGLRDARGAPLAARPAFARVRDGEAIEQQPLRDEAARLRPVLATLERHGVDLQQVVLAWDFLTASEEAVTGPLRGMVDDALARIPAAGPTVSEVQVAERTAAEDPLELRAISAQMAVPSYLASDDVDARLNLDAAGRPRYRGEQRFGFEVRIPRCAASASGPLPVVFISHGILGSPQSTMEAPNHKALTERLCMVAVAVAWIGLSFDDVTAVVTQVTPDLGNLPRITDRLHQAQVNAHALVRVMRGAFRESPAMQVNGRPVTDGAQIYYVGLSLSGIEGLTFAALSPDVERYVIHVGGGWWSLILERSSNWTMPAQILRGAYPAALDRLLLLALSQSLWDGTDPIAFARYLLHEPLPGRPAKRVLLQESRFDEQVSNLGTRAVARALGTPLLVPFVEPVYGVALQDPPAESAYVQWDVAPPVAPPAANVPAPTPPAGQSPHDLPRHGEAFQRQVERFLRPGGVIEHTCEGPCGRE